MRILASINLENEMDLMLAHQKTNRVTELLKLGLSTKTTFVTAVSEVARVIIDYTDKGSYTIGLKKDDYRYSLVGRMVFEEDKPVASPKEEDFFYAKKLVPFFNIVSDGKYRTIEFSLGLPRSLRLDAVTIEQLASYLENEMPASPYEALKNRQEALTRLAEMQQKQLQESDYVNNLKNEFFSIVSHELKTPLTIIKANTQIALSPRITCLQDLQPFLQSISKQCGKLSFLIEQLLDTVKAENGKLVYAMQEVDFNTYFNDLMQDLQFITQDHPLNIQLSASKKVMLDKIRIEQVFNNLISNAAKYSEKGKEIAVITSLSEDGMLLIEVKDNGIGMDENTLQKVFDKYYRDEKVIHKYAGLGMGMYISFKIVEDHGGSIWASSFPQKGSSFYFTLPLSKVSG